MNTVKAYTIIFAAVVLVGFCGQGFSQQPTDLVSGAALMETVDSVEQLLDYSPAELQDINTLIDGDDDLAASGIYALLRRSSMAPDQLEPDLLDAAAIVDARELLDASATFRGRLILFHLDVYKVSVINTSAAPDKWWGSRSAWRLDCFERKSGLPLVLIVSHLPESVTVGEFPQPVKVSTTALFAKVVRLPRSDGSGSEFYPLLVARNVHPTLRDSRSGTGELVFYILAVLMVVWWILNRRITAAKKSGKKPSVFAKSENLPPTGDFDSAPVNEKLVDEIKKYQQRKTSDGASDNE